MTDAGTLIDFCGFTGIAFAFFLFWKVAQIQVAPEGAGTSLQTFKRMTGESEITESPETKIFHIYEAIRTGAKAFLFAEYALCFGFIVVFSVVVLCLTSHIGPGQWNWTQGTLTAVSFAVGGITSIVSGYVGMMVAVFSNARTTIAARADGPAGWCRCPKPRV